MEEDKDIIGFGLEMNCALQKSILMGFHFPCCFSNRTLSDLMSLWRTLTLRTCWVPWCSSRCLAKKACPNYPLNVLSFIPWNWVTGCKGTIYVTTPNNKGTPRDHPNGWSLLPLERPPVSFVLVTMTFMAYTPWQQPRSPGSVLNNSTYQRFLAPMTFQI